MGASADKATMTIVEFADFRCGHCANAAKPLKTFAKANPDVRFEFQAFPLDGACNEAIPQANGTSCALAYMAHCANEQGKGFEASDWIFERQRSWLSKTVVEEKVDDMVADLGIDKDSLMECYKSDETHEAIKAQAELGKKVGVLGTPTIYVNNRKLPGGQMIPVLLEAKRFSLKQK